MLVGSSTSKDVVTASSMAQQRQATIVQITSTRMENENGFISAIIWLTFGAAFSDAAAVVLVLTASDAPAVDDGTCNAGSGLLAGMLRVEAAVVVVADDAARALPSEVIDTAAKTAAGAAEPADVSGRAAPCEAGVAAWGGAVAGAVVASGVVTPAGGPTAAGAVAGAIAAAAAGLGGAAAPASGSSSMTSKLSSA